MEILKRSPMFAVLVSLISGAVFFDRIGGYAFIVAVPLVFSAVCLCSYMRDVRGQWEIFIFGIIFALLCSFRMYHEFTRPDGKNITLQNISGTVISIREWGKMYALVIEADNGQKYIARFKFAEYMPGTRIKFDGVTQTFKNPAKGFNEARYWKARGVSSWVSISNIVELPEKFSFARLRYKLSRSLTIYMPELTGQYLKAAWLGERNTELNKKHISWGTSHLLAVSGFHVGIVILCAGFVFGYNSAILSIILWLYIILTGAAPSVLRAGLMIQAGLISRILGRPVNSVNCVSVAAVMLLIYSPFYFWDIGFRLSVLSALAITLMPRKKFMWLLISPFIFIITLNQVISTFKDVPLVGIFLNIFAPLYFAFAFTIASFFAVLRLLHVPFMNYALLACEGIFILWEKTANFFGGLIEQNYFTAIIGTVILIYFVCRSLKFSPFRTFAIMTAGSFIVFVMFM